MSESKSRIIVDDDWKSKVEAEKQTAQEKLDSTPSEEELRMPPASFAVLVRTLTTQALVALGQIPDPYTGQPVADLEVAKHFIDTLAMLENKTRGNLDPEEKGMLDDVLHQLRIGFVAMQQAIQAHLAAEGATAAGPAENFVAPGSHKTKGGIELP